MTTIEQLTLISQSPASYNSEIRELAKRAASELEALRTGRRPKTGESFMTIEDAQKLAARLRDPEHYVDACDEAAHEIVRMADLLKYVFKQRHIELHKGLDELASDWISKTGSYPSKCSVLELMKWSAKQQENPE